ncbi:hypothetical protein ACQP1V_09090 [Microtetraspora malaysiensis]|uniref:hypothetical protein n=1 Tax=Microtetraspora malaysiensis TaxID=161358 RepID=UPI003D8FC7CD
MLEWPNWLHETGCPRPGGKPKAIDAVGDAFDLSDGERQFLLTAEQGEALMVAGPANRVAFQVVASPAEAMLATSDPAQLAALDTAEPPPLRSLDEEGDPL